MNSSAWRTDDKLWMKQRRADWKKTKEKLLKLYFLKKTDINKHLKNFYLTGNIPEEDYRTRFWEAYM